MWHERGQKTILNEVFLEYEIDTKAGQSGSPIMRMMMKNFVIGVHILGKTEANNNMGLRIGHNNREFIKKVIK